MEVIRKPSDQIIAALITCVPLARQPKNVELTRLVMMMAHVKALDVVYVLQKIVLTAIAFLQMNQLIQFKLVKSFRNAIRCSVSKVLAKIAPPTPNVNSQMALLNVETAETVRPLSVISRLIVHQRKCARIAHMITISSIAQKFPVRALVTALFL
jgi:hypothetical protein